METFLSTAWRYLKGESGLPSLLPAKETVELGKEKSREVRLFCEGLEKFREILYTEPVDKNLASGSVAEDHNCKNPMLSDTAVVADDEHVDYVVARDRGCREGMDAVTDIAIHDGGSHGAVGEAQSIASSASSGMKMAVEEEQIEFPTERNQDIQDDATGIFMDNAIGKVSTASADTVQEHEHPGSESTIGKEPIAFVDTLHEQEQPGSESCSTAMMAEEGQVEERYIESSMKQVRDPLDATAGTDLTASAVIMQGQEHPISEKITVSGTRADQKPRNSISTSTGDDLFQSLDAKDKTPPTSPGGESSCSTLVDPSSRKVSPSGSTTGADASPTAVKDFAYSPWDNNHVRDPVSIIEENVKLELVRQLRKKMAGEQKVCREAEKQKGQNQPQCAEVEEARRTLLNREVRADLVKVHANAMILSNFVLQQSVQNITPGLTGGQHGANVQMTRSAGETFRNQEKEGSLHNHLECAGTFAASAYACTQLLGYSSDTSGEGLDDVESQGCIQQGNMPPMGETVQSKQSSPIESLDRLTSEELQAGCDASKDSTTASEGMQLKPNAEDSLDTPNGKVNDGLFEKPVLNAVTLLDTTNSLDPTVSEAINDVEACVPGVTAVTDETGIAIFHDNQQEGPKTYKDPRTDDETRVLSNSKAQIQTLPFQHDHTQEGQTFSECSVAIESAKSFEMANTNTKTPQEPTSGNSSPSEFSGIDDVLEANDDNSPLAAALPLRIKPERLDTQGTCICHEGGSNGNFEFSEAAGSATLWDILQSDPCKIEVESQVYTVEEATGVSDAAGPATLWGILRSNQSDNETKGRGVVEEEVAVVSAVSGPATLWGILRSDAHKGEVGEQEDADDAAAEIPGVEVSGTATDLGGMEDDAEVPPGPTNTPVDQINSSQGAIKGEGVPKGPDDAGDASAGDTAGAGAESSAESSRSEASPKVSQNFCDDEGAKSGDSDAVTRAGPSLEAVPAEKERPERWAVGIVQDPGKFGDLSTSHDNFGAGANREDHKTSNVAIVASSNTRTQTGDGLSGGDQALSRNESEVSPPRALSQPEAKVFDSIPPMSQPNEMSKTQKRKLERRRAAAKKAEARELMRKKQEEAAERKRQKKEQEGEEAGRAPASLAQRLAEEDSKLGEKRRMLQLARMEKAEAAVKSLGKYAGR